MKRLLVICALLTLVGASCSRGGGPDAEPTPRFEIAPGALKTALLGAKDVGKGWTQESNAAPSTVQVGGTVGVANVKGAEQEATSAFKERGDSGYVSNSLFLVESVDIAQAVIIAHRQADEEKWTQERKDGGGANFRLTGEVEDLPDLGEEMFTAAINAGVVDASGNETKRKIEYVVYRIDRLLAFVIAQDAGVSKYVRMQEQKVATLVG